MQEQMVRWQQWSRPGSSRFMHGLTILQPWMNHAYFAYGYLRDQADVWQGFSKADAN
jgi:hypothetical protein